MKKQCTKCKKHKSTSAFSKEKRGKYGLRADCKKCRNKYNQIWQQNHRIERTKYARSRRKTVIGCLCHCFAMMKHRCNNSKATRYKDYGGRGIKCRFMRDEFVNYVIGKLKIDPRGLQIDRIDNNGNYEPGNIRFVTAKENCSNRGD